MSKFAAVFGVGRRILTRRLTPLLSYHATYVVMGIGILVLDLLSGPLLMFPVLFVIPVMLSAWFCSTRMAYALAVLLPVGRFFIAIYWDLPASIAAATVNALVRIAVLCFLTFFVALTARQQREIKVLRGRLPICMWCKSIRNEDGNWEKLETYIAAHSEADFSHGLCPKCKQERYGHLFARNQSTDES